MASPGEGCQEAPSLHSLLRLLVPSFGAPQRPLHSAGTRCSLMLRGPGQPAPSLTDEFCTCCLRLSLTLQLAPYTRNPNPSRAALASLTCFLSSWAPPTLPRLCPFFRAQSTSWTTRMATKRLLRTKQQPQGLGLHPPLLWVWRNLMWRTRTSAPPSTWLPAAAHWMLVKVRTR